MLKATFPRKPVIVGVKNGFPISGPERYVPVQRKLAGYRLWLLSWTPFRIRRHFPRLIRTWRQLMGRETLPRLAEKEARLIVKEAQGRADLGFQWNVLVAFVNLFVFSVAVQYGIEILAWSYVAVCLVYFAAMRVVLWYLIGLAWKEYIHALRSSLAFGIVMFLVVTGLAYVLGHYLEGYRLLFALVGGGAAVYAAAWWMFERQYLAELGELMFVPQGRGV
jgi:hypothetical protein